MKRCFLFCFSAYLQRYEIVNGVGETETTNEAAMDQEGEKAAEGTDILLVFHGSFLLLARICSLIYK